MQRRQRSGATLSSGRWIVRWWIRMAVVGVLSMLLLTWSCGKLWKGMRRLGARLLTGLMVGPPSDWISPTGTGMPSRPRSSSGR